jgi:uncharacterized SAM-binding protein YcdF (DUF218 family)
LLTLRRLAYGSLLVLAITSCLFLLNYRIVLCAAGNYLVENSSPEKADAILVLAGDQRGNRIKRAAELVAQGYAPVALVSGPMEMYGVNEANLAIQYAIRNGAAASYFEPVVIHAFSTMEEAHAIVPEIRARAIHKLLLVTSNYHSRRAASIFRTVLGAGVEVRSIAAYDPYFRPEDWWQNREGQKTVFYEYSKTVAGWLGL